MEALETKNNAEIVPENNIEEVVTQNGEKETEITPEFACQLLEKLSLETQDCKFKTEDIYKFAYKFYKDKSGKAVHITYKDNCYLVALCQQINNGPFNPATAKTLGVLDVVGNDRRSAWQNLGSLSKDEAMEEFVMLLHKLTPTFKPYIQALWADHLEQERKLKEEELKKKEEEIKRLEEEENKKKTEDELRKQEETKRQIQEALNQQTFLQFKSYAEQQYPGNPEQQGVLIKQLQEQHYQQYMQQIYQQQLTRSQSCNNADESPEKTQLAGIVSREVETQEESQTDSPNGEVTDEDEVLHTDEEGNEIRIAPASMWTRRDFKDFKESIRQEGGDSIIKVGHGETVTVRVPTHEDGTCLFWEFATDNYDIGFGVYFEWTKDASNVVSVHITESDDEDDEISEPEENTDDIERTAGTKTPDPTKPPQSVIIPVYRRDCHEEVYAGSHQYPGTGVYLLKFDNSYSLLRNKVLYYKVYYTR